MSRFILIGSYIGEGVSGSHRQERLVNKALENGFDASIIKPSGRLRGIHHFIDSMEFSMWLEKNKPLKLKGSVNTNSYRKFFVFVKYVFFLDIFNLELIRTFYFLKRYWLSNQQSNYYLLVSSPSFAQVFATYIFSKLTKRIKYSVDMRDAWALHPKIKIFRFIRVYIEKKCLRYADDVLTISQYLKRQFLIEYNIDVTLLYNVNINIKDSIQRSNNYEGQIHSSNDQLKRIYYFGSLPFGFYRLYEFCEGILKYCNNSSKPRFEFHFYGNCEELLSVLNKSKFISIRNFFFFNENISHKDALNKMKECDALLFFGFDGNENCGIVSTKIFEYFLLGVKILAFDIRKNSDLEYLFKEICSQADLINTPDDLLDYLLKIENDITLLPKCRNINSLINHDKSYENHFRKLLKH